MSEWKSTTLSDVSSDISYGYTTSAVHGGTGPKFLRITDIVTKRINWEAVPACDADEKTFQKYKLKNGDIVVIAGKGHENYQEIDGVRHWFDDVVEVQAAIDAQAHSVHSAYPAQ